MLDLDRYYTPHDVADAVLSDIPISNLDCCVDSTCGAGNLLLAAQRVYGDIRCVGVDTDRTMIRRLRRQHPTWLLSVADMLNARTHHRAHVFSSRIDCDLLTLNPPFSMCGRRSVAVEFGGVALQTSVAMAHLLRSIDLFRPKEGAIAIVPESALFSEIDDHARRLLGRLYRVDVLRELKSSTFRGARANALVVRLRPNPKSVNAAIDAPIALSHITIVRGGLPIFEAKSSSAGLPLLHTTDILRVVKSRGSKGCGRVRAIARGIVSGAVVLVPRVGVPNRSTLKPVYLRSRVQLSDCVIALRCPSMSTAETVCTTIQEKWPDFLGLYRGTGSRYITVTRLGRWLSLLTTVTSAAGSRRARRASKSGSREG